MKTPGQVMYEVFHAGTSGDHADEYSRMLPIQRENWERAAGAVADDETRACAELCAARAKYRHASKQGSSAREAENCAEVITRRIEVRATKGTVDT